MKDNIKQLHLGGAMSNLYWAVYKNLEKELIILSEQIHINDSQLYVYSVKIIELLLRASVEIESIAKELYFLNKPPRTDEEKEEEPYFDTVCLARLEDIWTISEKEVLVSSPYFYFQENENKVLTPLKKSNKRGTSGADWKKAYQAVKHNRAKNLEKGNIKHFIRALAALYLLNIYYQGNDGIKYLSSLSDLSLGSDIFSVTGCFSALSFGTNKVISTPIDAKYTCISKYSDAIFNETQGTIKKDRENQRKKLYSLPEFQSYLQDNPTCNVEDMEDFDSFIIKTFGFYCYKKVFSAGNHTVKILQNEKLNVILNKNQEVYTRTQE